jgi:hypothetical protein
MIKKYKFFYIAAEIIQYDHNENRYWQFIIICAIAGKPDGSISSVPG